MLVLASPVAAVAAQPSSPSGQEHGLSVMQGFNNAREQQSIDRPLAIPSHEKQIIMFIMGLSLLIAVITTASLGVAMALNGKDVFVAHMIGAGVSVFLAIAHAVVAVVWFFPF